MKINIIFLIIFTFTKKTTSQTQNCSIVRVYTDPGQYTVNEQSPFGFCKEWVVGHVIIARKFLISFVQNGVKCNENDFLNIYDENRIEILNYCKGIGSEDRFLLVEAKYIFLRVSTRSNHPINLVFNFIDFETSSTFKPVDTTTSAPFAISTENKKPPKSKGDCPSLPKRFNEIEGTIEFSFYPTSVGSQISCNWLIDAQPNQRVQLDFEYLSLPTQTNSFSNNCDKDYFSISSYTRPDQTYKLCGIRRSVKIIATYHSVLLNLLTVIHGYDEIGFRLNFKILRDTSINPQVIPTVTTSPTISPTISDSLTCGLSITQFQRIIGGYETVPHQYPWQVLITDGFIMCGASLIDNSWLVTAAHCVQGVPVKMLKAYLGMHNRHVAEQNRLTKYISRIYVHPDYIGRMNQWDNDIALLKLQEPVSFTKEISPICLPPHGFNFAKVGTQGIVVGWGETMGTGSSFVLRETTISVSNTRECGANSENMICAGQMYPQLHDSCQGDSGGPFMMRYGKNYFLVGLVSWGYDCNGAGIYTKVSNYVNWINTATSSH